MHNFPIHIARLLWKRIAIVWVSDTSEFREDPSQSPTMPPTPEPTEADNCIKFLVYPDAFPEDIQWNITEVDGTKNGGDLIAPNAYGYYNVGQWNPGSTLNQTCINPPQAQCVRINLFDSAGDGLCCEHGLGRYELWW